MWLTKLVADDLKLEMIEKKREKGVIFFVLVLLWC